MQTMFINILTNNILIILFLRCVTSVSNLYTVPINAIRLVYRYLRNIYYNTKTRYIYELI